MCTLETEYSTILLDSDCFKSKEAITMSKKTKKAKANKGVYLRGNTWSYVIYPIDNNTGKKKQKMVGGLPSQQAAIEAKSIANAEILSNTYVPLSTMTLDKYLKNWFDRYKNTLQPSTIQGYWNNINLHILPSIGYIQLSKLDRVKITDFCYNLEKEGFSPRTIKYVFSILRKALNEAVYDGLLVKNPCLGAKRPLEEKYHAAVYDDAQVKVLAQGLKGTPIETEVLLALFLGLRRGEVLGLRFGDCDFDKNRIHICQQVTTVKSDYGNGSTYGIKKLKTKSSNRIITVPGFVMESILNRQMQINSQKSFYGQKYEDNDLVSCNANGTPRSPEALYRQFKRLINRLGLPDVRFHDLRHTYASLLLENDTALKVISETLGHSTISTTANIYVDILTKRDKPAQIMQEKFGNF